MIKIQSFPRRKIVGTRKVCTSGDPTVALREIEFFLKCEKKKFLPSPPEGVFEKSGGKFVAIQFNLGKQKRGAKTKSKTFLIFHGFVSGGDGFKSSSRLDDDDSEDALGGDIHDGVQASFH